MKKVGLGEIVVVRDHDAGVHFGRLVDYDVAAKSARLEDARRIWQWAGALSVHGLAAYGCATEGTKCDASVPQVVSTNVVEIVWTTKEGANCLAELPVWHP